AQMAPGILRGFVDAQAVLGHGGRRRTVGPRPGHEHDDRNGGEDSRKTFHDGLPPCMRGSLFVGCDKRSAVAPCSARTGCDCAALVTPYADSTRIRTWVPLYRLRRTRARIFSARSGPSRGEADKITGVFQEGVV